MFYTQDLPELKTILRMCYLPPGEPNMHGNCVFLFSKSVEESFNIIQNRTNLLGNMKYKYFYYQRMYIGKLGTKRYRLNDTRIRKGYYEDAQKRGLRTIMQPDLLADHRNVYIDLSRYVELYEKGTVGYPNAKKVSCFWNLFQTAMNSFSSYPNRYLLIPVDTRMSFSGSAKKLLENPIYLFYFTMLKHPELLKDINVDFLFYTGKAVMKWNPSHYTIGDEQKFRQQMKLLFQKVPVGFDDSLDPKAIEKEETIDQVKEDLGKTYNFTGDISEDEDEITNDTLEKPAEKEPEKTEVQKKVDDAVEKAAKMSDNKTEIDMAASDEIENDKQFIEDMYRATLKSTIPKSPASSARDKVIKEKQKELTIKGATIEDLEKIQVNNVKIPSRNISKCVHTPNKNITNVRFTNYEKVYNEEVMKKDMANVFTSLNNKSLPLYVIKMDIKDTSDELNYKETWTVTLEDTNRKRQTITVDIPKFVDNKFMYLGGNKKLILKQNFFLPVVKIKEDTVEIVTNENKMTLTRIENRQTSSATKLVKLLDMSDDYKKYFVMGNGYVLNGDYVTNVEYDSLSKMFLRFDAPTCKIFFSQGEAENYMSLHGISRKGHENDLFIGVNKSKPIFIGFDDFMTDDGKTIIDIIIENLPKEAQDSYKGIKSPRRLMYVNVKTMAKDVPMAVLLCYWEGIEQVLEKAQVKYRLTQNYPRDLKSNENVLRFSDCYLVYEENMPIELLMNGLRFIDTTKYKLVDFNGKDPYVEYFAERYGRASIANTIMNTYEFTLDPITKEILATLQLPTDLVNLCIYAIKLLADSRYTPTVDQSISRIRSNEIIPAILYDAIAKNYVTYKNSNGKSKLSVPRDIVIKNLLALKTVEDVSTLNPILELERTHTCLQKGWRGINLDDSYTVPKRAYPKSMIGVMGPTSSPDGGVGVQRVLTMEPEITSIRGFTKQPDNLHDLKDVNVFSPGELLTPLANTKDDATRMGHSIKQSKHVIPVKRSSPVLITNGAEEVCRFDLSTDFVINAAEDGEVVEYDEKLKIVICKYKSGKCQAIDLNPHIVKNGGGGFYLSNLMITDLKVGDKFKKDDLLAWHKDFFTRNQNGDRMNFGTLVKVAIMSTYNTYEDSSFITHKLSKDAETEMCFPKQVVVGKNSTVEYMAKVGDRVEVGDTLIQFDTSFEDDELNKMLNTISKELQQGILEDSRNDIKAKKSGIIEDIKIYSTVDLAELSPSLQKIVGNYYKTVKNKKALLEKYDPEGSTVKCGLLFTDSTKKVVPNKYGVIRGQKVEDSVLVEFYIKHEEIMEVGSKMA